MELEQPRRKKETQQVRPSGESQDSGVQAGRRKWPLYHGWDQDKNGSAVFLKGKVDTVTGDLGRG